MYRNRSKTKKFTKGEIMKKLNIVLVTTALFLSSVVPALAVENIVETVARGCEKEIQGFCKDVTPGEGRVLACLFAHNDKLSGSCEYALYDAAVQLERAIAALTYVANECEDDLEKFCAAVEAGEGRLAECLNKNEKKVSDRCNKALKDVGLK
jgi:hypothetical protein